MRYPNDIKLFTGLHMPVRFEIINGNLVVRQSFDFPSVYLDHWAIRMFSGDEKLGKRFIDALKASGGSLLISHVNLAEVTAADNPRHADEIAEFLEALLPNIYFAMFALDQAINQEKKPRDPTFRLAATPDIELLKEVARQRPDDFRPFTIANLVRTIAKHRDRLLPTWQESNKEVADHLNAVRKDPRPVKMAKNFKNHMPHIPTLTVMQEMMRPFFLDPNLKLDEHDAADAQHALISIVYADYVLLDGKWQHLHEQMTKRFEQLDIRLRTAKVFSKRRNGVETFLQQLEGNAKAA